MRFQNITKDVELTTFDMLKDGDLFVQYYNDDKVYVKSSFERMGIYTCLYSKTPSLGMKVGQSNHVNKPNAWQVRKVEVVEPVKFKVV